MPKPLTLTSKKALLEKWSWRSGTLPHKTDRVNFDKNNPSDTILISKMIFVTFFFILNGGWAFYSSDLSWTGGTKKNYSVPLQVPVLRWERALSIFVHTTYSSI